MGSRVPGHGTTYYLVATTLCRQRTFRTPRQCFVRDSVERLAEGTPAAKSRLWFLRDGENHNTKTHAHTRKHACIHVYNMKVSVADLCFAWQNDQFS